jgi:hypothetical protein
MSGPIIWCLLLGNILIFHNYQNYNFILNYCVNYIIFNYCMFSAKF